MLDYDLRGQHFSELCVGRAFLAHELTFIPFVHALSSWAVGRRRRCCTSTTSARALCLLRFGSRARWAASSWLRAWTVSVRHSIVSPAGQHTSTPNMAGDAAYGDSRERMSYLSDQVSGKVNVRQQLLHQGYHGFPRTWGRAAALLLPTMNRDLSGGGLAVSHSGRYDSVED